MKNTKEKKATLNTPKCLQTSNLVRQDLVKSVTVISKCYSAVWSHLEEKQKIWDEAKTSNRQNFVHHRWKIWVTLKRQSFRVNPTGSLSWKNQEKSSLQAIIFLRSIYYLHL